MKQKEITIDYTPRPFQREIHQLMSQHRFGLCVIHRRAGKTHAAVMEMIKHCFTNPLKNVRVAMIAPQFAMVKRIAWDIAKDYSRPIPGVKFNETELRIDYPNGARMVLLGAEQADNLRGQYFDMVTFDETQLIHENVFPEVILPAISDRAGKFLCLGTPLGTRNYLYNLYKKAQVDPAWFVRIYKVTDTNLIGKTELKQAQDNMTPEQYAQEFLCDWSANISGAIYGKVMDKMDSQGRLTSVPYDPGYLVHTAWDLGIADATSIVFFQKVGKSIHIIDYLEKTGEGLPWFIKKLKEYPYNYGKHYAPHDIEQRDFSNGISRRETAYQLGLTFKVAPKLAVEDGIHAVSMMLEKTWIDNQRCEHLIDALRSYHRRYIDKQKIFSKPVHDWSSHPCDATRTMALCLNDNMDNVTPPQQMAQNQYNIWEN